MKSASKTHLLLIPTYNTGPIVLDVVKEALAVWQPVFVVVDGSNDGTAEALQALAASEPHLTVLRHAVNRGKGSAIYTGLKAAEKENFTHILTMDADGQHPVTSIQPFMEVSMQYPWVMVLGEPVFDNNAPAIRVNGRKISNFFGNVETLWAGIHDVLFGFRVYPVKPLFEVMNATPFARRFDFDPEVVVRMAWRDVPAINLPVAVRYLSSEEGGVSHFHYLRDNVLLTWMHIRLIMGMLLRLPVLFWRKLYNRCRRSTNKAPFL